MNDERREARVKDTFAVFDIRTKAGMKPLSKNLKNKNKVVERRRASLAMTDLTYVTRYCASIGLSPDDLPCSRFIDFPESPPVSSTPSISGKPTTAIGATLSSISNGVELQRRQSCAPGFAGGSSLRKFRERTRRSASLDYTGEIPRTFLPGELQDGATSEAGSTCSYEMGVLDSPPFDEILSEQVGSPLSDALSSGDQEILGTATGSDQNHGRAGEIAVSTHDICNCGCIFAHASWCSKTTGSEAGLRAFVVGANPVGPKLSDGRTGSKMDQILGYFDRDEWTKPPPIGSLESMSRRRLSLQARLDSSLSKSRFKIQDCLDSSLSKSSLPHLVAGNSPKRGSFDSRNEMQMDLDKPLYGNVPAADHGRFSSQSGDVALAKPSRKGRQGRRHTITEAIRIGGQPRLLPPHDTI